MNPYYTQMYVGNSPLVNPVVPDFNIATYTSPTGIYVPGNAWGINFLGATGYNPQWSLEPVDTIANVTLVLNNNIRSYVELQNATGAVCGHVMLSPGDWKVADLEYSNTFWARMDGGPLVPTTQQAEDIVGLGKAGTSIALSADGNTMALGAPQYDAGNVDDGAVYIVVRNPNTQVWSAQQIISGDAGSEFFGRAVALSGDGNILVANTASGTGKVRVYNRSGSTWSLGQQLAGFTNPWSVAISSNGRTIAIGDIDGVATNQGKVHIYTFVGSTWTTTAVNSERDLLGEVNQTFGYSVALSADGNTLAIGAPELPPGAGAGFVQVAVTRDNLWTAGPNGTVRGAAITGYGPSWQYPTATGSTGVHLGQAVAISADGQVIVASAPGAGFVNIYKNTMAGTGFVLMPTQVLRPVGIPQGTGITGMTGFGTSVAISPDARVVAIGMPHDSSPDTVLRGGSTFVFTDTTGKGFSNPSRLIGTPAVAADAQGYSVALATSNIGCTLAVGAAGGGKAWVFV